MISLIDGIKKINLSLGSYERKLSSIEYGNRKMIRRSIVAKRNIEKNSIIQENDIKFARPGIGIPTYFANKVIGKKAIRSISAESLINFSMIKKK